MMTVRRVHAALFRTLFVSLLLCIHIPKPAPAGEADVQAPRIGIHLQQGEEGRLSFSPILFDKELGRRGFECVKLREEDLLAGRGLSGDSRCDLLVIPTCEFFPAEAVGPLLEYLKSGGRAIFVGGRRFADWTVKHEGVWVSGSWLDRSRSEIDPEKIFASFSEDEMRSWYRASGSPKEPTRISTELPQGDVGRALRVDVAGFRNWDVVSRRFKQSPLPDDPRVLTCFWAKGSKDLPQLSVEWEEGDGSRWIAVVELTTEWKRYVLAPADFPYWQDAGIRGRGGKGDRFKPQNARRLAFGLSHSHTNRAPAGNHTYWIAGVGWARDPYPQLEVEPPILETISPWYKTYVIDPPATLVPSPGGFVLRDTRAWQLPKNLGGPPTARGGIVSPVARTTGIGFVSSRAYRWIPLVSVRDEKGVERGTAASLLIGRSGAYQQSAWGYIGLPFSFKTRETVSRWIGEVATFLLRGVYLSQGGAERHCYFDGDEWSFKAEILNRSERPFLGICSFVVEDENGNTRVVSPKEMQIRVPPGETVIAEAKALMPPQRPGVYRVATTLSQSTPSGSPEIDRIVQEVRIVARERKPDPRRLVRVRGGDFVVDGEPWVPFGINFWPLSATGLEPQEYWSHWLSPAFYDPVRTQRDLERVRDSGMNVICVQYQNASQAPALMDLHERCRALDLKTFIYLPGGYPLRPEPAKLKRLIRAAHLAESDAVFAYDVAWEPRVGSERERRRLDPRWRAWIEERYGGIKNAEKDWGVAARRDDRKRVAGPSGKQLTEDGPHRVMVAAYRRFLDDTISQGYGIVKRAIREVDPHHLIGARSGYGGTGQPWCDDQIPFDLASGARHLDFISPEGYGHGPSWETIRNAGLTTLYGRLVGGGKPVWWAEYGMSVHPQPDEKAQALQGEMYENFARMIVESRANGGVGWWFPGGFRLGENSDYGIFNPDGTPRPAALVNREWAERVRAIRGPKPGAKGSNVEEEAGPDVVIVVDRDLHPRGYSQIRARHEKEYLAAVEAGNSVALATEATGKHSGNVPLVAIGNRPHNGGNPPKYLNAEFERFWVKIGDGEWREVQNGERVVVGQAGSLPARVANPRHLKALARAQVANTGETAWLPPDDPRAKDGGGVYLVSTKGSAAAVRAPLKNETPFLGDCTFADFVLLERVEKDTTLELELEAAGRARFGQRWRLHIQLE